MIAQIRSGKHPVSTPTQTTGGLAIKRAHSAGPDELQFRIELCDSSGNVTRRIARCRYIETARAAFKWAREQYPRATLLLRQGDKVLAESRPPTASADT